MKAVIVLADAPIPSAGNPSIINVNFNPITTYNNIMSRNPIKINQISNIFSFFFKPPPQCHPMTHYQSPVIPLLFHPSSVVAFLCCHKNKIVFMHLLPPLYSGIKMRVRHDCHEPLYNKRIPAIPANGKHSDFSGVMKGEQKLHLFCRGRIHVFFPSASYTRFSLLHYHRAGRLRIPSLRQCTNTMTMIR